jgi:hypothetical protein
MGLDEELQTQPSLKGGCVCQLTPNIEAYEQAFSEKKLK